MGCHRRELTRLGWDDWFERRADCGPATTVARVAAVDRGRLVLIDHTGTSPATLAGSFGYHSRRSDETPCVGDWVCVERQPASDLGLIRSLVPRRTVLRRRSAGGAAASQMIAANVDDVLIVQSCHFDFNVKRLERYLVMVNDGGADPHIVLTKTDLVERAVLDAQVAEIRGAGIAAPVTTLSNVTHEGIADLERLLTPGRTYCFVGSSGVGKSTLINRLTGRESLETGPVSGTGEGTHTTVRRELILLDSGALVIDNPGMREFGVLAAGDGIDGGFGEITSLAPDCRYRDCTHTREPGCAVLEAVESGEISRDHHDNYVKLKNESTFARLSHAEKRRKDRDFGRFIKSAKKDYDR